MLSDSSPIPLHPSVRGSHSRRVSRRHWNPSLATDCRGRKHSCGGEIESTVAANGATPATIAILDGEIYVGLTNDQLESIANRDDVVSSVRDLPVVLARSGTATTTVAATSIIAQRVGIEVFATGGLGGVHRQARETWMNPLTSPLEHAHHDRLFGCQIDLGRGATLERLETLNICLVGYRTDFSRFYLADSDTRWAGR